LWLLGKKGSASMKNKLKVSDSTIAVLLRCGFDHIDNDDEAGEAIERFDLEVSVLVTKKEDEKKPIDERFLKDLDKATDELNVQGEDEIDFEDLNTRIKAAKTKAPLLTNKI
jgi:hypothetical protein